MKAADIADRLETAPFQDGAALERAGLTFELGEQAAWFVTRDGSRYRGAAAVWATIAHLVPVVGDLLLALYFTPGLRQLNDAVYRWIAANRGRIPLGTPYLHSPEEPDDEASSPGS